MFFFFSLFFIKSAWLLLLFFFPSFFLILNIKVLVGQSVAAFYVWKSRIKPKFLSWLTVARVDSCTGDQYPIEFTLGEENKNKNH